MTMFVEGKQIVQLTVADKFAEVNVFAMAY